MPISRDDFANYLAQNELSTNTIRVYIASFLTWTDWAKTAGHDPSHPTPLTVRAWSETLHPGVSTIAHARAMFRHLCELANVPPASGALPRPREPLRAVRALDPHETATLTATAETMGIAGTAVLIGLYTAARRSEIASLSWDRVNWRRDEITLQRDKTRDMHTIPLHPELRGHLEPRHWPGAKWVLPGRYGGHVAPVTVWEYVLSVAENAGLRRITPHQLRHTAITAVYDATGDVYLAQLFAGHAKIDTTIRYTRANIVALRAGVGAISYRPRRQLAA